jgi:DNA replication and repair protein RecF
MVKIEVSSINITYTLSLSTTLLFLQNISLYQFKNYQERLFTFDKRIVCLTGMNGSGKTTLLDAIYFMCFTKSYFVHSDTMAVSKGKAGMRIAATMCDEQAHKVLCVLRETGKKEFSCDEVLYTQFSKHIGRFSCVFIAPDDTDLISEGGEIRRKFLDVLISQTNPNYMSDLIRYNKVLSQRNALLKQWQQLSTEDQSIIELYNQQLHEFGTRIFGVRNDVAAKIAQKANSIYQFLSDEREQVNIQYVSRLADQPLLYLLEHNQFKDILSQRTNYGIHKDDLVFTLNEMPFKQAASQGQRKSFLFGLKLAEYEWIKSHKSHRPLLLLDDIFEKLDTERSQKLIDYIVATNSQVFITDTHSERIERAFANHNELVQMITL